MKTIGICGGIGSGKSVVSKLFQILGIPVYDSDAHAKALIKNNETVKTDILKVFGPEAYLNNEYHSVFIAEKVFKDKVLLEKLNNIVHPAVLRDFENWIMEHKNYPFCIKEAAIMQKSEMIFKIITVVSPFDLRLKRIKKRDPQRSEFEIMKIINNQKTNEEFIEMSDFVIMNDEKEMLIPQVLAIKNRISEML